MKTINKIILTTILVLATSSIFAQNKFFEKYENMDGVTTIYISKAMFNMFSDSFSETIDGRLDLKNVSSKIDGLQIITSEKKDIIEKMDSDAKGLINKGHEELMRIKDGKDIIHIYMKKDKDLVKELLMTVKSDSVAVVMQLAGSFTLDEIKELTKNVKK